MGDFEIRGINDFNALNRLWERINSYIERGETDYLFSEGYLTWDFGDGIPSDFDLDFMVDMDDERLECFDPNHRAGCACVQEAANTDPRQGKLIDPEAANRSVQFVACAKRGRHIVVSECWVCFCDVEFHHLPLVEALLGEPDFSRY